MPAAPEDEVAARAVPGHRAPGADDGIRLLVAAVGTVREGGPDVAEMVRVESGPMILRHGGQNLPEVAAGGRRRCEHQIGKASCRERVCQSVWIPVVSDTLKKNNNTQDVQVV